MRKLWIPLLFGLACATASGQEPAPPILIQATQCLAAKTLSVHDKRPALEFGYWIDAKSYPGQQVIYVVDFLRSDSREGYVFTIFEGQKNGRSNLDIQNNGKFKMSASGKSIDFTEEILGGTWTHEQVESAIRRIAHQPRFSIAREVVFTKPEAGSCHSYADRESSR
jgi:hypothetical protein